MNSENGFSLIELLLVVLIGGVLAAIAVPAFLGHQAKGQDADARANARNVVTAVESCHTDTRSYAHCDTSAELEAAGAKVGVELTDATAKKKGAVSIAMTGAGYTVVGYSQSGNAFSIEIAEDGTPTRSCTSTVDGSCTSGVW